MNTLNKLLIASTIALASMSASAEFISTDLHTTGDSLATLDEATGIEWLDLTQTKGMSYDQVSSQLNTTFAGWRLPTVSEVDALMLSFYPGEQWTGTNTTYDSTEIASSIEWTNFFGVTYDSYSRGLYMSYDNIAAAGSLYRGTTYSHLYWDQNNYSGSHSSVYDGVYLVSDGGTTLSSINNPSLNANNANAPSSVPLPATVLFIGLGLTGLIRRKVKS